MVSEVAVTWDIACLIEFLKPKLGVHNTEFLTALVSALTDRTKLSALDQFAGWRNQAPVTVDTLAFSKNYCMRIFLSSTFRGIMSERDDW